MPLQYDPEFAKLASPVLQFLGQEKLPAIHDIDARRANLTAFSNQKALSAQIPNDIEQITHYVYARTTDKHDMAILHFRKKNENGEEQHTKPTPPGPAIVHMHGGGLIALSAMIGIVDSVQGLPPLYLDYPQIDIFAQEDMKYAARFTAANIPIELHVYEGLPHGFEGFAPTCGAVKRAIANRATAMTTI